MPAQAMQPPEVPSSGREYSDRSVRLDVLPHQRVVVDLFRRDPETSKNVQRLCPMMHLVQGQLREDVSR